jgi:hypothetical protein
MRAQSGSAGRRWLSMGVTAGGALSRLLGARIALCTIAISGACCVCASGWLCACAAAGAVARHQGASWLSMRRVSQSTTAIGAGGSSPDKQFSPMLRPQRHASAPPGLGPIEAGARLAQVDAPIDTCRYVRFRVV